MRARAGCDPPLERGQRGAVTPSSLAKEYTHTRRARRKKARLARGCGARGPLRARAEVYDVTPFLGLHPGGGHLIVEAAGKDRRAPRSPPFGAPRRSGPPRPARSVAAVGAARCARARHRGQGAHRPGGDADAMRLYAPPPAGLGSRRREPATIASAGSGPPPLERPGGRRWRLASGLGHCGIA